VDILSLKTNCEHPFRPSQVYVGQKLALALEEAELSMSRAEEDIQDEGMLTGSGRPCRWSSSNFQELRASLSLVTCFVHSHFHWLSIASHVGQIKGDKTLERDDLCLLVCILYH
jgi:hypothetical protein